jgi:hypothetical protein
MATKTLVVRTRALHRGRARTHHATLAFRSPRSYARLHRVHETTHLRPTEPTTGFLAELDLCAVLATAMTSFVATESIIVVSARRAVPPLVGASAIVLAEEPLLNRCWCCVRPGGRPEQSPSRKRELLTLQLLWKG